MWINIYNYIKFNKKLESNNIMKNIRLAKMEKLILERRIMSLKELQEEFGISMNTIRRDINELIENGNIKKFTAELNIANLKLNFRTFLKDV